MTSPSQHPIRDPRSPLTVLHVEAGRHLYGGALQVMYLLQGLVTRGVHNILVCPPGAAIAHAARDHAQVHELPLSGDMDLGFIARLRRVMQETHPDLIHLHSRRGADVLGGIAARRAGVPAVLSRRVDNPEVPWWARRKYRLYDRVITISQGIREVLLAEGVEPTRVVCVPSAVDTQHYCPGGEREWFLREFTLQPRQRAVGVIAQLIPRKGHRYLLAALPAIIQAVPQARFLLFGKGPMEAELRSAIHEAGLDDYIRLAGFRADLERILPCLDLVVHPAEMEGLGVSLLQAAACAVPIVASRAGGIPEVVRHGENGLLVPPGDAPALAIAVTDILRNLPQAQEMGQRGRVLVESEFSITAMVEGNLAVYKQVLRERESHAP